MKSWCIFLKSLFCSVPCVKFIRISGSCEWKQSHWRRANAEKQNDSLCNPHPAATQQLFLFYVYLYTIWASHDAGRSTRWRFKYSFIHLFCQSVIWMRLVSLHTITHMVAQVITASESTAFPPRGHLWVLAQHLCISNWIRTTWLVDWRRHSNQKTVIAVSIRLAPAATSTN